MITTPEDAHEEIINHIFEAFYEPVDAQRTTWRNRITGSVVRRNYTQNKSASSAVIENPKEVSAQGKEEKESPS